MSSTSSISWLVLRLEDFYFCCIFHICLYDFANRIQYLMVTNMTCAAWVQWKWWDLSFLFPPPSPSPDRHSLTCMAREPTHKKIGGDLESEIFCSFTLARSKDFFFGVSNLAHWPSLHCPTPKYTIRYSSLSHTSCYTRVTGSCYVCGGYYYKGNDLTEIGQQTIQYTAWVERSETKWVLYHEWSIAKRLRRGQLPRTFHSGWCLRPRFCFPKRKPRIFRIVFRLALL